MSSMDHDAQRQHSGTEPWNVIYCRKEIMKLPRKLAAWSRFVDHRIVPDTAREEISALLVSLQSLSYRLKDALAIRSLQTSNLLKNELVDELRDWRIGIERTFHRLGEDVAEFSPRETRQRLETTLAALEIRITESLEKADEKSLTDSELVAFYDILGAYRSLSHATIDCVERARPIDWSKWRESRF